MSKVLKVAAFASVRIGGSLLAWTQEPQRTAQASKVRAAGGVSPRKGTARWFMRMYRRRIRITFLTSLDTVYTLRRLHAGSGSQSTQTRRSLSRAVRRRGLLDRLLLGASPDGFLQRVRPPGSTRGQGNGGSEREETHVCRVADVLVPSVTVPFFRLHLLVDHCERVLARCQLKGKVVEAYLRWVGAYGKRRGCVLFRRVSRLSGALSDGSTPRTGNVTETV